MKPIDILKDLLLKESHQKYPNLPDHARPIKTFKTSTANGLTQCIIKFLTLHGWQAERVSSTGRMIDNTKTFTDAIGRTRKIGTTKWIKGTGTAGTADISSVIKGRSVKIEVKIGKDRQSDAQKKYQKSIEKAGGIYWIVKNFDEFYEKYLHLV